MVRLVTLTADAVDENKAGLARGAGLAASVGLRLLGGAARAAGGQLAGRRGPGSCREDRPESHNDGHLEGHRRLGAHDGRQKPAGDPTRLLPRGLRVRGRFNLC